MEHEKSYVPRYTPFLVKKAQPVRKFTPQPITSVVEYLGP